MLKESSTYIFIIYLCTPRKKTSWVSSGHTIQGCKKFTFAIHDFGDLVHNCRTRESKLQPHKVKGGEVKQPGLVETQPWW